MVKIIKITLFPILALLSIFYEIIVTIRHFLYDHGILKSVKPETWVISIGNITVGGTGKTPITISIVKDLLTHNYRPVIISRGYKRESSGLVIVSDGKTILENALKAGDEPYLLASNVNVPVICCEDRLLAAEVAIDRFKADFIVLDDGFQHRRIGRDFDIVAIDSLRFLGNHFLLPFGILRDTIKRLYKADLIILTKADHTPQITIDRQLDRLKRFNKPVIISKTIAVALVNQENRVNLTDIKERKISLFCGLGLPTAFYNQFQENRVSFTKTFADHHKYSSDEINTIIAKSKKHGSEYLITTEKDFYNLPTSVQKPANLYYLEIKQQFFNRDGQLIELAKTILESKL